MVKSSRSWLLKISNLISAVFNPINSLVIFFIYFSIQYLSKKDALSYFIPLFLLLIVPISGWIIYKVKKKEYTDMDVSDRKQRHSLYFLIMACMIVYLLLKYMLSDTVDWVIFYLFILLLVLQVSNYFIKSSMHTALNIYVAALFFAVNPLLGFCWAGIALVVAISRIILKRHTPAEVATGAVLAIVISFIYLYSNIQTIYYQ